MRGRLAGRSLILALAALILAGVSTGQTVRIRPTNVDPAATWTWSLGGVTIGPNKDLTADLLTLYNPAGSATISFNGSTWIFSPALEVAGGGGTGEGPDFDSNVYTGNQSVEYGGAATALINNGLSSVAAGTTATMTWNGDTWTSNQDITAPGFVGDGSSLLNLPAGALTGVVPVAHGGTGATTAAAIPAAFALPGPVINVKTYGAVGDGVTDDYAAIVAAIAAIPSYPATTGATLFFPKGVYRTSSTITISKHWFAVRGEGPHSTYIKLDTTTMGTNKHTMTLTNCSRVSVQDIGFDGTNSPNTPLSSYASFGYWGSLRIESSTDVMVNNFHAFKVHDAVFLRSVNRVQLNQISVNDTTAAAVAMAEECYNVVVTNLRAESVSELVDVSPWCSNIVIDGVTGTGNASPRVDEAFDVGGCNRVRISNVVASGFDGVATIKYEIAGSPYDVDMSNCTITGFTDHGLNITTGAASAANRISVRNCKFITSTANIGGIAVNGGTPGATEIDITDNYIDVPGIGISAIKVAGLRIRGNRVKAGTTGIQVSGLSSAVDIRDNVVSNTSTSHGIYALQSTDVTIAGNTVTCTGTATGIRAEEVRRPTITGNKVLQAGLYGIHVYWSSTTYLDSTAYFLEAAVDGNVVRNWGEANASARSAIYLQLGFSDAVNTWAGFSISRNRCIRDSSATGAGVHTGIQVALNGVAVDYNVVDGNLCITRTAGGNSLGSLGANSVTDNNVVRTGA